MNGSSTARAGALVALTVLGTVGIAGCTGAAPSSTAGAATQSMGTGSSSQAASGDDGGPAPSSSPGASPKSGASGASPTQQSMLDAVKHTKCSTSTFIREAGLAGGALRAYVSKPAANGALVPGAAGPVAQARAAVGFASTRLQHAGDALKGCPSSAKNLRSVLKQNVNLLTTFRKELAAGTVSRNRSDATTAMFANVVSQADHLRLKVTEVVPSAAQLGR